MSGPEWAKQAKLLVPGKHFKPSIMFAYKARSHPKGRSTILLVKLQPC
jgi:hypothetical protein